MQIISVIEDEDVIKKILKHLDFTSPTTIRESKRRSGAWEKGLPLWASPSPGSGTARGSGARSALDNPWDHHVVVGQVKAADIEGALYRKELRRAMIHPVYDAGHHQFRYAQKGPLIK